MLHLCYAFVIKSTDGVCGKRECREHCILSAINLCWILVRALNFHIHFGNSQTKMQIHTMKLSVSL